MVDEFDRWLDQGLLVLEKGLDRRQMFLLGSLPRLVLSLLDGRRASLLDGVFMPLVTGSAGGAALSSIAAPADQAARVGPGPSTGGPGRWLFGRKRRRRWVWLPFTRGRGAGVAFRSFIWFRCLSGQGQPVLTHSRAQHGRIW
ncbi:hypothetical protein ACF061_15210 [Streptomyces sp. NPDC015220]|uniref:hypothetical protein n=1 Tax=Streptomyces sp. NPDC015220 TaxID=3364947 RepID=UPI0036FEF927